MRIACQGSLKELRAGAGAEKGIGSLPQQVRPRPRGPSAIVRIEKGLEKKESDTTENRTLQKG